MNLKVKSALLFTAIVAAILLVSYVFIYFSYKWYKEDEFFLRLEQKALTTYKLLTEVKEIDYDLLKVIDKNTINEMYNEKVLIFDENYKLIYSSIDDHPVTYSIDLLKKIEHEQKIAYRINNQEVVGISVQFKNKKAIIMASAYDTYGSKKLYNLLIILIGSYFAALVLTAILAYFFVKQTFTPIEVLNKQITRINQNRLNERVPESESADELNQLAKNFNQMLNRIELAFKVQRSFIQHASHELRTPLANLITSCELALNKNLTAEEYKTVIKSLNEEHLNLVEVTNALLLLSQHEGKINQTDAVVLRADEALFETIDEVQQGFPSHIIKFNIKDDVTQEQLYINFNPPLLKTVFNNLIRNACKYSENKVVNIKVETKDNHLNIHIENDGEKLTAEEIPFLMEPFFRGNNAISKKGFGLGLSITKRIAEMYKTQIIYTSTTDTNVFTISIPLNKII